ncbi:polysaccharide deacetylase family protein [Kaistia granuli]|uniref:polysaccharide deacetylase family protein n=1 Tax=Kaistia granuli TaxID=363259 RepID=UPI0003797FAD|nr:polysaccharide deacetylase family protein [Kaistia granuli]
MFRPHALAVALLAIGASLTTAATALAKSHDIELKLRIAAPPPGPRVVALTFDACSGTIDRRILDMLVKNQVPATLFVTHRWLKRNQETTAVLLAHPELFEIENHGDQHVPAITDTARLYGLKTAGSLEEVRKEVDGGASAVLKATGKPPRWFRGATAVYSQDALEAIRSAGYSIAGFSLNADMGASLPAATVAKRIAAARSGDVIIAHINQPGHPAGKGVVEGIQRLIDRGTVFVKLDDMQTEASR